MENISKLTPTLYDKGETNFNHNGLGKLTKLLANEIDEVLNGEFEAFFEYPANGHLADKIDNEMFIKAKPNKKDEPHIFKIYDYELDTFTQTYLIYARSKNVEDLRNNVVLDVNVRGLTPTQAWNLAKNNALDPVVTTFYSDITTASSVHWERRSLLSTIAGQEGSMIQYWGGEIKHGVNRISLFRRRGQDNVTTVRHGKNLDGLKATYSTKGLVTAIVPYYVKSDDKSIYGNVVKSQYINNYPSTYYDIIEYNDEELGLSREDEPENGYSDSTIKTALNRVAKRYFDENAGKDLPSINMEISLEDISQTKEYEQFKDFEQIEIGDTITVYSKKFNVNINAKVRRVVYNGLTDKNELVEVGTARRSLYDDVRDDFKKIETELQEGIDHAMTSANGKNTNYHGTADPNEIGLVGQNNDNYFRTNGQLKELWVYRDGMWHLEVGDLTGEQIRTEIAEQQQNIEKAKQTADEAVDSINTAVANAGFTSLDATLQNMNYITRNAEQNAQQAITNASNAYGLAQTSISEAQTAQANSLTALGKADNALDGVSSLNVRVDDVEAELELKADNTFMNEDGTLTTLSNAITFNAHRFSRDMSRIESRVESLAGEINLVILRDAFENSRLNQGTMYPTPGSAGPDYQTMRELIAVQGGEKLAMSKETSPSGFNQFRFNFYDDTGAYLTGETVTLNQYIVTVPQNATKMWVSYPTGSKPQIVRGTIFVPYRPNLADQMTTEEMELFRNEYDEYADRTERRLSAIDTSGGSLDVLNNKIISTAEQVTTDMTALINTKVGDDEFTEFYQNEYLETAREVSRKISLTDINPGERNLLKDSGIEKRAEASDVQVGTWEIAENIEHGEEVTLVWEGYSNGKSNIIFNWVGQHNSEKATTSGGVNEGTTIHSVTFNWKNADNNVTHLTLNKNPYSSNYNLGVKWVKLVKGNITSLDWVPAYEDTQEQISHIETEWTQAFDTFSQTVSGIDGRVTEQKQTIDSISGTVSGHGSRISTVEQTASGLQSTVASKANQSQVTQLSNVWQASVGKLTDFIYNSTFEDGSSLGWEGITVETGYTHSPSKYYGAIRQRDAYFGDLIPIEGGERLNFSIHAWNFTVSPQPFKFGVRYYDKDKNPISWYTAIQSSKGNVLEKHTASWTASASARYVRPWVQISAYSNFTPWFFSQPQISRVPTNAQISMLENNINVRVQKGDLLSQINIEADRQLFQSGKMLFDAENVIFTGKAWIPSSVIGDLEADKITSGTLDAGQITVVNLDALSITTNRAQMVQAGFNAINSSLSVDGNSLTYTHSNGSQTILSAGGLYHREGGTNYQSHYLMEVGTETIDTHDLPITGGRLVTLPSVFRGKPFKVIISIADVLSHELTNYQQFAIQRLVAFPAKDSINHANGTFRIFGYARMTNTNTREIFHSRIQVQYTVIA